MTRGWLGVTIQPLNEELAESFGLEETHGALVAEVVKGSPAEKAGLKRGDVIMVFDGHLIEDLNDLPQLVAVTPVDKSVKAKIFRDGKARHIEIKIGQLEEEDQRQIVTEKAAGNILGITVVNPTPDLFERYNLKEIQGVLVRAVAADGPAAKANIRVGDLIVELDGKSIDTVAEFEKVVGKLPKGKILRLLIQRQAALLYTTIKVE